MKGFSRLNADRISSTMRLIKIPKKRLLKTHSSKNTEGIGYRAQVKG